jgi:hypothetical protein
VDCVRVYVQILDIQQISLGLIIGGGKTSGREASLSIIDFSPSLPSRNMFPVSHPGFAGAVASNFRCLSVFQCLSNLFDTQIFLLLSDLLLVLQRIIQGFNLLLDIVLKVKGKFFCRLLINLLDVLRQLLLSRFC